MILTGKCREEFEYKYNMSNFNELDNVLQNARLIEFFDSIGFYIDIHPHLGAGQVVFYPSFCYVDKRHFSNERNVTFDDGELFYTISRQEALKEVIELANEFYNDINK